MNGISQFALFIAAVAIASHSPEGHAMGDVRLIIPGGELDSAFTRTDVFVDIPAAVVPPGRACQIVRRYVDLINAGDYLGVAALYADDATFLEPIGPRLHGRAQIDEFYTKQIGSMKPTIAAVSYLGDDSQCMVSLARRVMLGGRQRYVLVSVDDFLIDGQGHIKSMVAFARPPRS